MQCAILILLLSDGIHSFITDVFDGLSLTSGVKKINSALFIRSLNGRNEVSGKVAQQMSDVPTFNGLDKMRMAATEFEKRRPANIRFQSLSIAEMSLQCALTADEVGYTRDDKGLRFGKCTERQWHALQ